MNHRLKQALHDLGVKNREAAQLFGVTPNAVTETLKGRTKNIPIAWLRILSQNYQIDIHWLITGEGTMLRQHSAAQDCQVTSLLDNLQEEEQDLLLEYLSFLRFRKRQSIQESVASGAAEKSDFIHVPLLGHIAAGTPILADENCEAHLPIAKKLLPRKGRYFALRVQGDSMIGADIQDGDIVFLDADYSFSQLRNRDIVAVLIDQEATLKFYSKDRNQIILLPANPAYRSINLQEEDNPCILGKMVGLYRQKQ